jgi:Glycosyltransferase 61
MTIKFSRTKSHLHLLLMTICALSTIHSILVRYQSSIIDVGKVIPSLSWHLEKSHIVNGHDFSRTRHWCIIDDNTTQMEIGNIAHAAQVLISCWNWFQRQSQTSSNTSPQTCLSVKNGSNYSCQSYSCGFFIGNLTIRKKLEPLKKSDGWISLLIEHMPCVLTDLKPTRHDTVWHRPDLKLRFDSVESALKFQSSIFQSYSKNNHHLSHYERGTIVSKDDPVRVGLVNRRDSRYIRNLDKIREAFQKILPTAHFETCFMEDLSPFQQWIFWSSKHIVLAAHGQAETNAIFLPANSSAIIEVYPPHYYSPFFTALFRSMGIHHFPYFNDAPDWRADYVNHSKTLQDRNYYRGVKEIEPNISSLVKFFEQAIIKIRSS